MVRVRVRFLLFYSEHTPTDPWCNMLRDFTWTEKYEEAMSDEHPLCVTPFRPILSTEFLNYHS